MSSLSYAGETLARRTGEKYVAFSLWLTSSEVGYLYVWTHIFSARFRCYGIEFVGLKDRASFLFERPA